MQGGRGKKYFFRAVALACLIGVAFILASVWKEMKKKKEIQDKITQLQQEAEKISRENSNLEERIAYLGSDDYKQKEAKDKLNLQSPGENVVIIKKNAAKEDVPQEKQADPIGSPKNEAEATSNPKKWWNYFFGYQ
jgi:cell division protein FtsB